MQQAATILSNSLKSSASAPAGEQTPTKQELKTLTDGVKLEASKIGLMWASSQPSPTEAQSLFSALEHRHSQLFTLLCRAGYGGGPTLCQSLQSVAAPVTEACVHIVNYMSSTKVIPEGQAAKQVAKVWAACDTASTACLDNKTAIGRQLLHSSRSVKDNIRELQEVIVESQACSHSSGAQSVSDDANSEVDLDFEADAMSPFELELAESSIPLLQVVLDVFKLLIRTLLTEDIVSEASTLDDWESLLFHAKGLSAVSNDLGAALFAPQDASEVTSAAGSLNTGCELVFDEFPGHLKDGHAEATESLIARLADAHAGIHDKTSADVSSLTM
ncbi:TPA: hypothetical protein ACH3X2_010313 [Trebouxia sp. C0005]